MFTYLLDFSAGLLPRLGKLRGTTGTGCPSQGQSGSLPPQGLFLCWCFPSIPRFTDCPFSVVS